MPAEKVQHRCVRCGTGYPHDFTTSCTDCGGLIDVEYDLGRATLRDSADPLERFVQLLPIEDERDWPPFRLHRTPCVRASALGARLGLPHLYLKDETGLPTGSTKDRMAAVALPFLRECGVRAFTTSSTGNSSTAYAHAIARLPGMRVFVFTAESFVERVDSPPGAPVVHFVLEDATFVDAFNCAGVFAARHQIRAERGFFNPGRREGLKLAFLEASDQVPGPIDWYVQAISSAMGVYGTFKGARELQAMGRIPRLPRLLCVQQETCAPMVRAFEDQSPVIRPEHIVPRPTGIASAILRGDPTKAYPYVREMVEESGGTFVSVSEHAIREARLMVEELEGLRPCFNSAAALAGLIRLVREDVFPRNDTVLVNLTGRDRSPGRPHRVHRLRIANGRWAPVDPDDAATRLAWEDPMNEANIPLAASTP